MHMPEDYARFTFFQKIPEKFDRESNQDGHSYFWTCVGFFNRFKMSW